ncbi:hypothetical protein [Acuticoccus sp.]|uniref:hypothetical protein n=1 Tax=Acuticoccus sp. TaxID=1904378 RepID=UPI003B51F790
MHHPESTTDAHPTDSDLDRRSILALAGRWGAVLALAPALAACNSDDDEEEETEAQPDAG